MKKILFSLSLAGFALTACDRREAPTTTGQSPAIEEKTKAALGTAVDKTKEAAGNVADKTKELAGDVKDAWNRNRLEWRLSDSDIKADLERSGRVVREKTAGAGEKVGVVIDNTRVVMLINSKFVGEPDLSAFKINVDADHGIVTLKGSVKSLELVGRATALALDTEGVIRVVALLRVEP